MQHRKTFRLWSLLVTILLLFAVVAGCAQPAAPVAPAPAPGTAAPAAAEPTAPAAEAPAAVAPADGERFTIGVSNGFVGSEWRTQ